MTHSQGSLAGMQFPRLHESGFSSPKSQRECLRAQLKIHHFFQRNLSWSSWRKERPFPPPTPQLSNISLFGVLFKHLRQLRITSFLSCSLVQRLSLLPKCTFESRCLTECHSLTHPWVTDSFTWGLERWVSVIPVLDGLTVSGGKKLAGEELHILQHVKLWITCHWHLEDRAANFSGGSQVSERVTPKMKNGRELVIRGRAEGDKAGATEAEGITRRQEDGRASRCAWEGGSDQAGLERCRCKVTRDPGSPAQESTRGSVEPSSFHDCHRGAAREEKVGREISPYIPSQAGRLPFYLF